MIRLRVHALAALMGAAVLLSGCATKRDVRTIQDDIQLMQMRQAELLRDLQQQNRLLLDSIRHTMTLTQDVRGATASQLRQFEQNVDQLGNLVSQVMGTLTRIEQRLAALEQRAAAPAPGAVTTGGGTADEYYEAAMQRMTSQSWGSARALFEQLVTEFPAHEQAPNAQYHIGETYYQEKAYDDAYRELEKVAQQWPTAPRAREALMRAGEIAEEQKDNARARQFYTQVRDRFSGTEEARLAQRKLQALPRR
jgi:tol-pal system protein YbgF